MAESARGREDSGKIDLKSLLSEMNEEENTKPEGSALESGVRLATLEESRAAALVKEAIAASIPPSSASAPPSSAAPAPAASSKKVDAKPAETKPVESKTAESKATPSKDASKSASKDADASKDEDSEKVAAAVAAKPPAKKEGRSGATGLLFVVAAGAICVGAFFGMKRLLRSDPLPTPAPVVAIDVPPVVAPVPKAAETAAPVEPTAEPVAAASASAPAQPRHAAAGGKAPAKAGAPEAPAAEAKLEVNESAAQAGGGAGDLGEALRSAVGAKAGETKQEAQAEQGEKRATLRPSPGAVTGAINSVLPAARVCLGADAPAVHATIVFDGNGVGKGKVTRSAANEFAAGCIEDALSKARVTPFAEAPYSVNVTVRP